MTGIALVYTILEIANEYTLRREDGDAECISSSPERMVEPVVITSSTIRMCRFSSRIFYCERAYRIESSFGSVFPGLCGMAVWSYEIVASRYACYPAQTYGDFM